MHTHDPFGRVVSAGSRATRERGASELRQASIFVPTRRQAKVILLLTYMWAVLGGEVTRNLPSMERPPCAVKCTVQYQVGGALLQFPGTNHIIVQLWPGAPVALLYLV